MGNLKAIQIGRSNSRLSPSSRQEKWNGRTCLAISIEGSKFPGTFFWRWHGTIPRAGRRSQRQNRVGREVRRRVLIFKGCWNTSPRRWWSHPRNKTLILLTMLITHKYCVINLVGRLILSIKDYLKSILVAQILKEWVFIFALKLTCLRKKKCLEWEKAYCRWFWVSIWVLQFAWINM